MRSFLAVCFVLAAVVLGVGYWRGWFLVDRDQIREDTQKAVEQIKGTSEKISDKIQDD
ncbi:MAG: hypothetical protein L0Y71_15230 [Gemmataceae bacterium]|nr:hypothetical protein [Gemmataceae bacterium]